MRRQTKLNSKKPRLDIRSSDFKSSVPGKFAWIYLAYIFTHISLDLKKTEINKESKMLAEAVEERKTSSGELKALLTCILWLFFKLFCLKSAIFYFIYLRKSVA